MPDTLVQFAGWTGTFLIVLAYFLISSNKINSENRNYQLLNLFGAAGIGVNVFYHRAWPAFAMESVWALIAVYTLIKPYISANK